MLAFWTGLFSLLKGLFTFLTIRQAKQAGANEVIVEATQDEIARVNAASVAGERAASGGVPDFANDPNNEDNWPSESEADSGKAKAAGLHGVAATKLSRKKRPA